MRSISTFSLSMLLIILVAELLLLTKLASAIAVMNGGSRPCNGSVTDIDCLWLDEKYSKTAAGEFINELYGQAGTINVYKTTERPQVCEAAIAGSCFRDPKPGQRPCDYYNYCGGRGRE